MMFLHEGPELVLVDESMSLHLQGLLLLTEPIDVLLDLVSDKVGVGPGEILLVHLEVLETLLEFGLAEAHVVLAIEGRHGVGLVWFVVERLIFGGQAVCDVSIFLTMQD